MIEFDLVVPECTLLVLACCTLLVDVFRRPEAPGVTVWFAICALLVVLAETALIFPEVTQIGFTGTFKYDAMGNVLKALIAVLVLLSYFYARDFYEKQGGVVTEYYILSLFAVLGMYVLVSAASLLTIYLGLELLSLCLYSMVAMQRDSALASEAAMKYFILGALASGMLLYGMSLLYGVTGSLELGQILVQSEATGDQHVLMTFALVFVVVGVAFKLGVVPFHMWLPDVYQGAATPVTLFVGTAPKLAAFAMTARLLADALQGLAGDWQQMLVLLAVLSMAVGNVVAIAQTDVKRMLAYSTIAHMGFLLLGLIAAVPAGYASAMFYVIVYALMSMGAFGAVILNGRKGFEANALEDFSGLARRSPWFAFVVLILMFSLAGVPPFAGFWAKWYVLKEVIDAGFVWLGAVAVLFSIVGAFYYLRIIKLMYFDEPLTSAAMEGSQDVKLVLSVNGLAVLALGLMPGALMSVCISVIPLSLG